MPQVIQQGPQLAIPLLREIPMEIRLRLRLSDLPLEIYQVEQQLRGYKQK